MRFCIEGWLSLHSTLHHIHIMIENIWRHWHWQLCSFFCCSLVCLFFRGTHESVRVTRLTAVSDHVIFVFIMPLMVKLKFSLIMIHATGAGYNTELSVNVLFIQVTLIAYNDEWWIWLLKWGITSLIILIPEAVISCYTLMTLHFRYDLNTPPLQLQIRMLYQTQ